MVLLLDKFRKKKYGSHVFLEVSFFKSLFVSFCIHTSIDDQWPAVLFRYYVIH